MANTSEIYGQTQRRCMAMCSAWSCESNLAPPLYVPVEFIILHQYTGANWHPNFWNAGSWTLWSQCDTLLLLSSSAITQ